MGLGNPDFIDDEDGGGAKTASVLCSVCLEVVADNGDRSRAKLQCGHKFHLDCIGSAFNMKGKMQCPNCRKIEKGQWLYANNCRPFPEFNMEDWAHDEDLYDLIYSELSFGVHWCPFIGLTRLQSSFDEGEFSSTAYHDLHGQHAIFAEHTAASHPCPYVGYLGPILPPSSNSSGRVSDDFNISSHWNSQSAPSEIPTSYAFPYMDIHHHNWVQQSANNRNGGPDQPSMPHRAAGTNSDIPSYDIWEQHSANNRNGGPDQPSILSMPRREAWTYSDIPRSGSFVHPFHVGRGSNARDGNSVASSGILPYPGSATRARDHAQALQAYFQHPPSYSTAIRTPVMPARRRPSSERSLPQVGPVDSLSDQASGFYFFPSSSSTGGNFSEAEHTLPNVSHAERECFPFVQFSQVDRDPTRGRIHQLGGCDSGIRSTSFRQSHGSEGMPYQYRS